MIVAVLNTKGGVGKTTTALNLAIGRALAGCDVLAVDGDRQGSLVGAFANRRPNLPPVAVAHYTDGKMLHQQVALATRKYSDIVIDAGGRDSTALRAALLLADLVLIPFQPRSFDVWALDDMAELVAEVGAIRDVRAMAFLAMADARGHDNLDAAREVPGGIEYLEASIGRRKAIADAAGVGEAVIESRRDEKASAEIRRILAATFR
jgi:chromosome partitioning protein